MLHLLSLLPEIGYGVLTSYLAVLTNDPYDYGWYVAWIIYTIFTFFTFAVSFILICITGKVVYDRRQQVTITTVFPAIQI